MSKVCTKCKEEKPLNEFVKDSRTKDGTRSYCKECYNKGKRKNPEKPRPKPGYKYCASCGVEKKLSEFNTRMILKKLRPFSYCKECEKEKDNNRYCHVCEECGLEYRSGQKNSKICKSCHNKKIGAIGAKVLKKKNGNQSGEKNHMYGVSRFGEENPNYNPDKTDEERIQERLITGYKEWRAAVYERDQYACQVCADKRGGNLIAHHMDGYNWCREKRLDPMNGVTLCETCHSEFHKQYGFKDNTKEQYESFLRQANTEVINQMAKG